MKVDRIMARSQRCARIVGIGAASACWLASSWASAEPGGSASASGDAPSAITWKKLGAASGQPLIFLPALSLPGRYWSKVYEQFEKDHPIYVVTYAGSDGVPPTKPPYLDRTVEAVHQLIESEKLKDPVLVGHLLGASVALRVAGKYPDSVAGVFAQPMVLGHKTLEQRRTDAKEQSDRYRKCSADMWIPTLRVEINAVIPEHEVAQEIADLAAKADQATYAGTVEEMFADEIEPWLPKIKAPVYLIVPVFVTSVQPDIDRNLERLSSLTARRRDMLFEQFPNIARCDTFIMRSSQFFPMMQAPGRLAFVLGRYLRKLSEPTTNWDTTATTQPSGK